MVDGQHEFSLDLTGEHLKGRYRVDRLLAEGGMAAVYLATDTDLHRLVVIKVPKVELLADREFRERFARETRSLIGFDHPHVVTLLDAGAHRGVPYVVLRHLGGGSLEDRMAASEAPIPLADALDWLLPIAKALDFIHKKGFVHRDVKPANIIFDEDGNPFLGDFGITRAIGRKDIGLTQTGSIVGSPPYMPPEVAQGAELTPAYDQYSLATVVYHAVSKELPHEAETPLALMTRKVTEPPLPLREAAPGVPAPAAAAVMRALSKSPSARFATCEDFALAFAAGAAVAPTPARSRASGPVNVASPGAPSGPHDVTRTINVPSQSLPRPVRPAVLVVAGATLALTTLLVLVRIAGDTASAPEPLAIRARPTAPAVAAESGPSGALAPQAAAPSGPVVRPRVAAERPPGDESGLVEAPPPEPVGVTTAPAPEGMGPLPAVAGPIAVPRGARPAGVNAAGFAVVQRDLDGARMVAVPGSTFVMGADEGAADERPAHRVTLSPYFMDEREVTWGQWRAYMRAHGLARETVPTWSPGADEPVVNVDWAEAAAYCEWVGGRLPTEAEWELAARGPQGREYPWGAEWDPARLNAAGDADGHAKTAPVGSYPSGASPFGLLDMGGNVAEWTADWYDARAYRDAKAKDPKGPPRGRYKVARGGSWSEDAPATFRAANRARAETSSVFANYGMRCVVAPR